MEQSSAQCEQLDSRSSNLARQCASLETQLTDAQSSLTDDKKQLTSAQLRIRQLDGDVIELQEQVDEQNGLIKQHETKLAAQNAQVCLCSVLDVVFCTVPFCTFHCCDLLS